MTKYLDKIRDNQADDDPLETFQGLNTNGITDFFEGYRSHIQRAVSSGQTTDRVIALATSVITRTPEIRECTPASIFGAIMRATVLGLDFAPDLGQCYLIPRYNKHIKAKECTFLIGYQGFVTMAFNTDMVASVSGRVVFENDYFKYAYGLTPILIHEPLLNDAGEKIAVYCVWHFTNGGTFFEVFNKQKVMAAKSRSPAAKSEFSPWNNPDDEDDMWIKTVIRHSRKYVPTTTMKMRAFKSAMTADDEVVDYRDYNRGGQIDFSKILTKGTQPVAKEEKPPENGTQADILKDTKTPPPEEKKKATTKASTVDPNVSIGDENAQPPD